MWERRADAIFSGFSLLLDRQVAWAGIPTAPAWLPASMLEKSDKLDYIRM